MPGERSSGSPHLPPNWLRSRLMSSLPQAHPMPWQPSKRPGRSPLSSFSAGDPVADGLVTSLARPGGNVTGLSSLPPERIGKCLELLTQAVPGVSRVAVLWQPGAVGDRTEKDTLKGAE